MMIYIVLALLVGSVYSDYDCLCNYNVEKTVYLSASNQGQPLGYLYEFDCKQIIAGYSSSQTWATVAYEHQVGYVETDSQTSVQVCPGDPPDIDIVTTTTSTTIKPTTTSTTMKPTTTSTTMKPTITPTTMKPTTTSTTIIPTTTSTTKQPTTTSTTMKPTTTSTTMKPVITSTTMKPTTTSTTMSPTTTSTTMKPSMTSTTVKPTTTSTTVKQTTTSRTLNPTTSTGRLVCPLNVQQAAQGEGSVVFVNDNNGKCYELVTFKRTWSFAEDDCKSKGGHLTSVVNTNEENVIYGYVKLSGASTWIGLNDKNTEEHFEWISGDAFAYSNWKSGRKDPNSHFTQDCVSIDSNTGLWDDEYCSAYHAYVCKFDAVSDNGTHITQLPTRILTTSTAIPTTTSGNRQLSCPQNILQAANNNGWFAFVSGDTGKCYELVENHRTWDNAENDCQRNGGHLATIDSQSVENLLYGYVKSYGHATWIGLNDQDREEHFKWSSGYTGTYFNWHPGRKDPDFHRFEDCVAMGAKTGTWEDMDCLYSYYAYICEFDAVSAHQGTQTSSSADGNTQLCSSSVRHLANRDNAILGQYERGCYELMRNAKVSWQHGEDMCQSRGGHLAHISTAQQQSFIQSFMQRHSPQHAVWIGLHDTQIEGAFQWTAGTSVTYTNWIQGHESNFESFRTEDCVAFIPYKNGKWDDIPCGNNYDLGETHPVLCQYKIPLSPGIVG